MTTYYLDPSAWVKGYFLEPGSAWVRGFWAKAPNVACSTIGLVEALCAVRRGIVLGRIDQSWIVQVLSRVESDFAGFERIAFDEPVLRIARQLPVKHTLRGADAIHLASLLRLRQTSADDSVLVSSDQELLAAAAAEGVATIDPRTAMAPAP